MDGWREGMIFGGMKWMGEKEGSLEVCGGMEGMEGSLEVCGEMEWMEGSLEVWGGMEGIGGGKERSLEEWKGWEEGRKDLWRNGRDGRREGKIFGGMEGMGGGKERSLEEWKGWEERKDLWRYVEE